MSAEIHASVRSPTQLTVSWIDVEVVVEVDALARALLGTAAGAADGLKAVQADVIEEFREKTSALWGRTPGESLLPLSLDKSTQ